ncbi:hypothetical protein Ancab_013679 [Ancistrocladus abbreviatus]
MATTQSNGAASTALPLQDRVAIVTGSSRGIGKAVALRLASFGAKLVINYTSNKAQAEEVVSKINSSSLSVSSSPRAIAVQADVTDPAQVKALFDTADKAFQDEAQILVACAGLYDTTYPSIANTTVETFQKTLNVNTMGTFLCIREAANRLKRGSGGRIITFSSILAKSLAPGFGAYAAAKAANEAMTKTLAKELRGTKITANCVAPGPTATEMLYSGTTEEMIQGIINESPLLRLGEPKDVAALVGFLVSDEGEWVNGQVVRVTGGAFE